MNHIKKQGCAVDSIGMLWMKVLILKISKKKYFFNIWKKIITGSDWNFFFFLKVWISDEWGE